MGVTIFPAPAAGLVDNYELIATVSPTSGSAVSFTSIPTDFRKLLLTNTNDMITFTTTAAFNVTVNSLASTNSYTFFISTSSSEQYIDEAEIRTGSANTDKFACSLIFVNPLGVLPVTFTGGIVGGSSATTRNIRSGFVPSLSTPITQIDLTLSTGAIDAGSTGTLQLFGTK